MMEGGLGMDLTLLVSLAIIPAVFIILALCLKIKASKSNPDIYGIEGTVKRTDDYAGGQDRLQVPGHEDPNIRTPSYDRKLPDIPNDPNEVYKNSVKEDSSSELYATVDDRSDLPNHLAAIQGVSGATSLDPAHHPYAKVKKKKRNNLDEEEEHPYAKVERKRGHRSQEPEDYDDDGETETEYETAASLRNGGHAISTAAAIDAHQTAVGDSAAGGSPFLPSWGRQATPLPPEPPHTPEQQQQQQQQQAPQQQQQQFFSGDSQDSGKGYTSISVREPLEMIRTGPVGAATASAMLQADGNYATLSETSDEMYAAIEEDNVYMDPEGSAGATGLQSVSRDEVDDPSLMYSKVDKNKKRTLRRNEGGGGGGYAIVNKSQNGSNNRLSGSSLGGAGRRPLQQQAVAIVAGGPWQSDSGGERNSDGAYHGASPVAASNGSEQGLESGGGGARPRSQQPRNQSDVDYSGYEVSLTDNWNSRTRAIKTGGGLDPGYETVPCREPGSRVRQESFSERDPGYEVLPCDRKENDEGRNVRDPDYEVVPSAGASDLEPREPDYETLPHRFRSDSLDPGYETLTNKGPRRGGPAPPSPSVARNYGPRSYPSESGRYSGREPGYESLADLRDPDYESVIAAPARGTGGGGGEPGYETLPERPAPSRHHPEDSSQDSYGHVSKRPRAAPPARSPRSSASPRSSPYAGQAVRIPGSASTQSSLYAGQASRIPGSSVPTTGPEVSPISGGGRKLSLDSEEGYETIPADEESAVRIPRGPGSSSYATGQRLDLRPDEEGDSLNYDRLDKGEINYIDDEEDQTVESSSSSLIHMSVVETGPGVRRSSVVVIERFALEEKEENSVETHIFV